MFLTGTIYRRNLHLTTTLHRRFPADATPKGERPEVTSNLPVKWVHGVLGVVNAVVAIPD